jgi:FkbM family methyltransferase
MSDEFKEDERILSLLKSNLPLSPVIFDVGASNGKWSVAALKIIPDASLFLFEPLVSVSTSYSEELQATLRAHPQMRHFFPVAIGDRNGTVDFHVTADNWGSTALDWKEDYCATPATVEMRTIDSVIAEGLAPLPDLIKMDIQGGELMALRGAIKTIPKLRALHVETWTSFGYGGTTPLLHDIMDFLRPYWFRLFDFGTAFRKENGVLYSIDVCFVNEALRASGDHPDDLPS